MATYIGHAVFVNLQLPSQPIQ